MRRRFAVLLAAAAAVLPALARPAAAQVHIGVTISTTGPAASLGIPQRNSIALLPQTIGGMAVEYVVLDDGGDSTRAVANMRKLIDENGVDAVIGSSTTPASLAMVAVAGEKQVPMITLAASVRLIAPMDDQRRWVFKAPQNDSLMADAIADHMAASGVRTVGFIGFNDAYGDGWLAEATRALEAKGIRLVATERFARSDTSVTGQVLKLVAARPDAVLIAGAGTPAALPQKALHARGYNGKYYQTHGVANMDFIRVGGRDVEGTILPSGPVLVASQLPASNPIKAVATDLRAALRGVERGRHGRHVRRPRLRRGTDAASGDPGGPAVGAARHASVPRRPARRAGGNARAGADARRVRHDGAGPQRLRPPGAGDGDDPGRNLEAASLTAPRPLLRRGLG